ncbi:threonine--tRNA ligase [Candidatus Woesebacteria bacterium]|nr:MAG: threonine--tRNA ligase [Candidatus Woesebacteria bacterium]
MKKIDETYLSNLRHSSSHLLAASVLELYPKAKLAIGPSIDKGFYYDIDFGNVKVGEEDLAKIEERMHRIVKGWKKFDKIKVTKDEALKEFSGNEYKKELIEEFTKEGKGLTIYRSGDFRDLCKGGHIANPSQEIKFFKLLSLAGAYWRGDEKNKMLTRIYGTAFASQKELDEYLIAQEEAQKRDHRKLGKDLDLFTFSDLVGAGLPLYTPKGAFIRLALNKYIEDLQSPLDYQQVWTPQIGKASLFKISGHYAKYKDDMFKVISNYSDEEMYLKPMNCPQHTQIFASKLRSYKDLPIRMTDFAMLYRDERPGELSGLARVRSFSQDDCHIFCMESQVDEEIDIALSMIKKVMNTFGFTYRYRLSIRDPKHPEKYLGNPKTWDKVEKWAEKIMKRNNIDHYDGPGEAAFYAPKMDLMATDALGREWQLSTVQIDYVQPERFELYYINEKGEKVTPIMIHRAVIGSPERFMMILLEHLAGNLPVWLSPQQAKVLPITERNIGYSNKLTQNLKTAGVRVAMDNTNDTLGNKIRKAQNEKIPYMLVIGDKEEKAGKVALRTRNGKDLGQIELNNFIKLINDKNDSKDLDL